MNGVRRIHQPRLKELGLVNWIFCRIAAKKQDVHSMHLFTMLGQHRHLLWAWLPFSGFLLYRGKLSRRDTELVILRVAYLCASAYETQQHRVLAKRVGLDDEAWADIRIGPSAWPLMSREEVLLRTVDEFVYGLVTDQTRAMLAFHLSEQQQIELYMLIGQYEALAKTIRNLDIPLDEPR